MTRSSKFRLTIIITFALLLLVSAFAGYTYSLYRVPPLTEKQLIEKGIDRADKLMIVAHPDDEVLWGGAHLMEKGYFVVVMTNGNNAVRKQEFDKVLEAYGNDGIILSYPDKSYGTKDSWSHNKDDMIKDLETIINYKHWDLIVTHNADGEYGHIHHKMTHTFVADIYSKFADKLDAPLYFFGKYYTKDAIGAAQASLSPISDDQLAFKEETEKLYKSQKNTIAMFSQMNPYEEWTLYSE